MSTYQSVISVITAWVQQYIVFNILGLLCSQRRPKAIKERINALSQNTVTALLSLDIERPSGFPSPHFSLFLLHAYIFSMIKFWISAACAYQSLSYFQLAFLSQRFLWCFDPPKILSSIFHTSSFITYHSSSCHPVCYRHHSFCY